MHISSSYDKILGGNKFSHTGDSTKWVKSKRRKRKKERPKLGNNNGQLCIATPPRVAHAKPPGPILFKLLETCDDAYVFSCVFQVQFSIFICEVTISYLRVYGVAKFFKYFSRVFSCKQNHSIIISNQYSTCDTSICVSTTKLLR